MHTHLMVEKHGRTYPRLPTPFLPPTTCASLYPLHDDDELFFRVLSWVEHTGASKRLVQAVMQILSSFVESGGRIDDLLVDASLFSKKRTPFGHIEGIEKVLRMGSDPGV